MKKIFAQHTIKLSIKQFTLGTVLPTKIIFNEHKHYVKDFSQLINLLDITALFFGETKLFFAILLLVNTV